MKLGPRRRFGPPGDRGRKEMISFMADFVLHVGLHGVGVWAEKGIWIP